MRENQPRVRECDAKHGSGQHHHDGALQLDRFLRIRYVHFALPQQAEL
jgi:hypothetical protein